MSKEITPSRKRVLIALMTYGPMISLRPFPGSRRGFQLRVQWFLTDNGYIANKAIPAYSLKIPHYYLTEKGRKALGFPAEKSLRETLNDFIFGSTSPENLRQAILAHPVHVSPDDPMGTNLDLIHTAEMVLDRIAEDRP